MVARSGWEINGGGGGEFGAAVPPSRPSEPESERWRLPRRRPWNGRDREHSGARTRHRVHGRNYLSEEVRVLREVFTETTSRKRIPFTDEQPELNPSAERFVKTVRSECLEHFVFFGGRHLRHLLRESCAPYHGERSHQALDRQLITPPTSASNENATGSAIHCRVRPSGLLNYYHREAA